MSLAFARPAQDSVRLLHLSRQLWLVVCSGTLLAVGLILALTPLSRGVFWTLTAGLATAVLASGLLWPGWLPTFLYGCQPGGVVLLLILGIQWMLQERYRRHLVFMPGFARLKTNSSLVRSSPTTGRREASTIDAPASGLESGKGT